MLVLVLVLIERALPMLLRKENIDQLKNELFDVAVVGDGINGAVAAAALSTKGAKVALIDNVSHIQSSNAICCVYNRI